MTAESISNVFDSMASMRGLADVGLADVGLADVGLADVGLADVGLADVGLADVGLVGVFYSIADVRYRVTGLVQHDHT